MTVRAAFPGSFDPLTVAHLAVADAVRDRHEVERVDLVLSRQALEKVGRAHTPVEERAAHIASHSVARPWLAAVVTEAQLLVDIAVGYDLLIVGADKWHQLHDPRFYGDSEQALDDALARLPRLLVVPRAGVELPVGVDEILRIEDHHRHVSSTAVRRGREEWRA